MDLNSSVFLPNNSLAIKFLKINKHMAENWIPIEIQIKYNWICTLQFLHSIIQLVKILKLNGTCEVKLKSNWIFSDIWLLIYTNL